MTTEDGDELWTLRETATYLRKPVGTLRQWRHRGLGPKGFRVGRDVLYRRSEVMRWLAEREASDGLAAAR